MSHFGVVYSSSMSLRTKRNYTITTFVNLLRQYHGILFYCTMFTVLNYRNKPILTPNTTHITNLIIRTFRYIRPYFLAKTTTRYVPLLLHN